MKRTKSPVVRFLIYFTLIIFMLSSIVPFAWTFLNSIKLPKDANARVPKITGFSPTAQNYVDLWLNTSLEEFAPVGWGLLVVFLVLVAVVLVAHYRSISKGPVYLGIAVIFLGTLFMVPRFVNTAEFYDYLINSIIVTTGTLVVSIAIGCLAGYGLARYRGHLGVVILVAALAFRSLPWMAFVLPFYYMGQASGLYDTHILLIITLVAVNQPFTIWMLRSFFMEIPGEIEEAAMIDGASRIEAFWRVIIPIMWPGIITTALFTLLLAYNNFLLPRILTQTNWTLPVGIAQFTGGEDPGYITLAAAGSVSIVVPIIIIIIVFQRHLIKGLAFGAVKG